MCVIDEHDINGARAIVLQLCRDGLKWYRKAVPNKAWKDTYEAIGGELRTYRTPDEVEGTLLHWRGDGAIAEGEMRERCILLAPPRDHSVVCLLGSRWRLSAEHVDMSLYLHLFGESQEEGVRPWYRGYRLELPHGPGIHDYTHVQPVNPAGWREDVAGRCAELGVPEDFPAFPLRGRSLTTLCATLAIALNGTNLVPILHALRGSRMLDDVQSLLK